MRKARTNRLLLTTHIAVSVAVFGMELVLVALGVAAARGVDPRQAYPAGHLMAQWLMAPLGLAALGTGLLLVLTTGWSPSRHWWVTVKLAVTAILTVLVFAALIPGLTRMADKAVTGTAITSSEHLRFILIPAAGAAVLALNIALGVIKPGGRARRALRTPVPENATAR
ncbi:hypothetical protein ACL02O_28375 [Micromonospora sp. MS34]|uniref:hypothetical protein n=1 Tax=Micromonospora sp. MS34 TaxID=3385971 RepID=UPI0039A2C7BE